MNVPIGDNDRPGVIAARAVGRLLVDHGILAGDRICIVEVPEVREDVDALARALAAAGAAVERVALADALYVRGRSWASAVEAKGRRVDCDVVAAAAIPAPASEGPRQHGCAIVLDPPAGGFKVVVDDRGRTTTAGVWACGDVTGYLGPARAAEDGARVAANLMNSQ